VELPVPGLRTTYTVPCHCTCLTFPFHGPACLLPAQKRSGFYAHPAFVNLANGIFQLRHLKPAAKRILNSQDYGKSLTSLLAFMAVIVCPISCSRVVISFISFIQIENALLTYQTGRAQLVFFRAHECRHVFAAHVEWIERWKDSTTERIQAWKDLKDTFSTILK
jgi:hypothetical protein